LRKAKEQQKVKSLPLQTFNKKADDWRGSSDGKSVGFITRRSRVRSPLSLQLNARKPNKDGHFSFRTGCRRRAPVGKKPSDIYLIFLELQYTEIPGIAMFKHRREVMGIGIER
jgi:hypothetical protein